MIVSAITDVGMWRWWTAEFPKLVQLEFGGVQIYEPPEDPTKPPLCMVAMRFRRPKVVAFMRRAGDTALPADWYTLLHDDAIEPFALSFEKFALDDAAATAKLLEERTSEVEVFRNEDAAGAIHVAFWAGPAGVRIEAEALELVTMKGTLTPAALAELHGDWWTYWKDYWKKRGTPDALPQSFACEVTIPLKAE